MNDNLFMQFALFMSIKWLNVTLLACQHNVVRENIFVIDLSALSYYSICPPEGHVLDVNGTTSNVFKGNKIGNRHATTC